MKKRAVHARFERDEDGYWAVTAALGRNDSAISDGQTLPKARRRIVDAVALHLGVPPAAIQIVEEIALPVGASRAVRELQAAANRYEEARAQLDERRRRAAAILSKAGVSRRDVGDILGVSGARIQQLLARGSS
jgi:predicted RNase H-like HicB family nuclease